MKIVFGLIAVLGYTFNINNYKITSYILWLTSNTMWAIYSLTNNEKELAIMFGIYNIFCAYGIFKEIKFKNKSNEY